MKLKSNILFEPLVRIELTTSSLPRKCSTTELQRLFESLKSVCQASQMGKPLIIWLIWLEWLFERKTGLEPATWSLEGYRSTKWATSAVNNFNYKELPPSLKLWWIKWAELDSNQRTRERTDLQSVAFSHSAICPYYKNSIPATYFFSEQSSEIPEPKTGVEPATYWLQISCSTNWAISACFYTIKNYPHFWEGKGKGI